MEENRKKLAELESGQNNHEKNIQEHTEKIGNVKTLEDGLNDLIESQK